MGAILKATGIGALVALALVACGASPELQSGTAQPGPTVRPSPTVTATITPTVGSPEDELEAAQALYDEAKARFENGTELVSLRDLLSLLDEAVELNPDFADAYAMRGSLLMAMREDERGLEDLNLATELDPDNVAAYLELGFRYAFIDYQQSIAYFDTVLDIEPDNGRALGSKMYLMILLRLTDADSAIETLDAALASNPDDGFLYLHKGLVYQTNGDLDTALDAFATALTLFDGLERGDVYFARGNLYNGEDNEAAIADYEQGLAINVNMVPVHINLAELLRDKDDLQGALEHLDDALYINDREVVAYENRAEIYAMREDYDSAIEDYSHAIEVDPEREASLEGRGAAYISVGEYAAAVEDYSALVHLRGEVVAYLYPRARAYEKLEDWPAALQDLDIVLAIEPERAEAYLLRAIVYENLGRPEEALSDYRQFLELITEDTDTDDIELANARIEGLSGGE